MNFLFVAVISVILATGVFNTESKDSEGNKKTETIVKESSETKPTEEKVKAEVSPSQIILKDNLNKIGIYKALINFHSEVKANISIKIEKIQSK